MTRRAIAPTPPPAGFQCVVCRQPWAPGRFTVNGVWAGQTRWYRTCNECRAGRLVPLGGR